MPIRDVSVFIYRCQACQWELVWPVHIPPSNGRMTELQNRVKTRVCSQCGHTGAIKLIATRAEARSPAIARAR